MIAKGLVAAFVLCLGLALASCGSFSDLVADHWPHIAGGEPNGVPPRPGEPGYRRFIAHGQPIAQTNPPSAYAQPTATVGSPTIGSPPVISQNSPQQPEPMPQQQPVTPAKNVVQGGGLY
jgi:hypothetical protein